jgi:L-glyceraldehyde 3-phosphate reductase
LATSRYLDGVPEDSRAKQDGTFHREWLNKGALELVRALNKVASARGQTLAQMAIAWVLRDRRVTSALIGASTIKQLEENLNAVLNPDFTSDELATIDQYAIDLGIDLWESSRLAG